MQKITPKQAKELCKNIDERLKLMEEQNKLFKEMKKSLMCEAHDCTIYKRNEGYNRLFYAALKKGETRAFEINDNLEKLKRTLDSQNITYWMYED